MHKSGVWMGAGCAVAALGAMVAGARGGDVSSSNFDEVAMINTLGGTITQLGGGPLNDAGDFVGPVTISSGVNVTLPGFSFLSSIDSFIDTGATEPGNIASAVLGSPTDLTFTFPGVGSPDPDGTAGDGSLHFTTGDSLTASFGGPISTAFGSTSDLVIFTDTACGGFLDILLYSGGGGGTAGSVLVDSILNVFVADSNFGTSMGGIILDLSDDITFDTIVVAGVAGGTGSVEIDAIAAANIPAPGTVALLGMALAIGTIRRHRPA